jgi:hypothetical protein
MVEHLCVMSISYHLNICYTSSTRYGILVSWISLLVLQNQEDSLTEICDEHSQISPDEVVNDECTSHPRCSSFDRRKPHTSTTSDLPLSLFALNIKSLEISWNP